MTEVGGVKCWGLNSFGQLGAPSADTCEQIDGSSLPCSRTPIDVAGLAGVVQIAVGDNHACALAQQGQIKCWGGYYFCGMVVCDHPVDVPGLENVSEITAGIDGLTCAVTVGGVKCWGGQFRGDGEYCPFGCPLVPADVVELGGPVHAIDSGGENTCVITNGGGIKCWGYNDSGQLGSDANDGSCILACSTTPVDVVGLTSGVSAVATGGDATCAVLMSNVKCWGSNQRGQLGSGSGADSAIPLCVELPVKGSGCPIGDASCDGRLNSVDAVLVLQFNSRLLELLGCPIGANVNHDAAVDAIDAALILQYDAGLLHTL